MYQIGELVIYSSHGICRIDDICQKTILGKTRQYYVLRPIENKENLTINAPIQQNENLIQRLINIEEANEILQSFKDEGIEWEENANVRYNLFNKIVQQGNRKEIAKVINTLLKKKRELKAQEKNLHKRDEELLRRVQNILYKELSIALDVSLAEIEKRINDSLS